MLAKPAGILTASTVWGILTVAWNGYQIAQGATHEAYLGATVTAGAAAVLSWAARNQASVPKAKAIPEPPAPLPAEAKAPETNTEPPIQPPAPAVPVESLSYSERFRTAPLAAPAPPAQADRVPIWLYAALVLAGLFVVVAVGLVIARPGILGAAVATAMPTAKPTIAQTLAPLHGDGIVRFGTGYDPATLAITGAKTTFKVTADVAWSASLSDSVNATKLHWVISKVAAGGSETVEFVQDIDIGDPSADTVANKAELGTLLSGPGIYVMRYLRDSTILAEGSFTLTK
jgi:hypothetical protein